MNIVTARFPQACTVHCAECHQTTERMEVVMKLVQEGCLFCGSRSALIQAIEPPLSMN